MTSFNALATSVEGSRPIELYELTIGSTTYRYTNADADLSYNGNDYLAVPITRSKLSQSQERQRRKLTIKLPTSLPLPQLYVTNVPGETVTVTLFRLQRDEVPSFDTQVLLFTGIVQSCAFEEDTERAALTVQSLESALGQNVPRMTFMGQCNNFLYDQFCGVNPDDFDYVGAATAVDGNTVTVSGAAASGIEFTGGYARPTGSNDFRLVVSQSGDDLTLLLPFSADVVGSDVQIFAGCDHLIEGDCALVFDNVLNFSGFAFVPNKNVFQSGLDE
jgi:uncharacterized phage protein (TIGR02218 family)